MSQSRPMGSGREREEFGFGKRCFALDDSGGQEGTFSDIYRGSERKRVIECRMVVYGQTVQLVGENDMQNIPCLSRPQAHSPLRWCPSTLVPALDGRSPKRQSPISQCMSS